MGVDTIAPSVPANLAGNLSSGTPKTITLTWGASTDNVGVADYQITRKAGTSTETFTVNATTFIDSTVTEGTTYKYQVRARDAANNFSAASNEVTVETSAGTDTEAPSVPASLISTGKTTSTVSLSWAASTDNVAVAGYDIYRGTVKAGTSTTPAFTDTGLAEETSYTYTIKAFDAANNFSAAIC